MLPVVALLWFAHTPVYDITNCRGQDGTITVDNPAISYTYWLQDTTCTFDLAGYDKTIDAISITRSKRPMHAGRIAVVYNGATTFNQTEDIHVDGEGEPFAILPMWNTRKLTDVHASHVYVTVQGKAQVSFGMAEDPGLVFGEVVPVAYHARDWVYGAPFELLYLHVGLAVLAVLAICYRGTGRYVLTAWIAVSIFADYLVWVSWVWHEIGRYGGDWFISMFFVRALLYSYLVYLLWEKPKQLGEWKLWKRYWLVPALTGLLLSAYVFSVLYMGRDAFTCGCPARFYVGITAVVAIVCWIVPVAAALSLDSKQQKRDSRTYRLYLAGTCLAQLLLVTLVGLLLNVGLGALAPLCVLVAFRRRLKVEMAVVPVDDQGIELTTPADNQGNQPESRSETPKMSELLF